MAKNPIQKITGLLIINGTDIGAVYGAFLYTDQPGRYDNTAALMHVPPVKKPAGVTYDDEDGTRYADTLDLRTAERDFSLTFGVMYGGRDCGSSFSVHPFVRFLRTQGRLDIGLPTHTEPIHCFYLETQSVRLLGRGWNYDRCFAIMKVKFREYAPNTDS